MFKKTEFAELLIKNGAKISVKDKNGHTPLHLAALYDNMPMVKLLLKNGASPFAKDKMGRKPADLRESSMFMSKKMQEFLKAAERRERGRR